MEISSIRFWLLLYHEQQSQQLSLSSFFKISLSCNFMLWFCVVDLAECVSICRAFLYCILKQSLPSMLSFRLTADMSVEFWQYLYFRCSLYTFWYMLSTKLYRTAVCFVKIWNTNWKLQVTVVYRYVYDTMFMNISKISHCNEYQ